MITTIIKDSGEKQVVEYTYQALWREMKDIPDASLLVSKHWLDVLDEVKTTYVCFVEADCLVSSGYFNSQIGLFKKNPYFRKLAMLSTATAVNKWDNKFYGYTIGDNHADGIVPVKTKKSSSVYPVQVGYVPGAVMRMGMLTQALQDLNMKNGAEQNLVELSTVLSLAFWQQGDGNRVHINPNSAYVTTEDYVNDITKMDHDGAKVIDMFRKESI